MGDKHESNHMEDTLCSIEQSALLVEAQSTQMLSLLFGFDMAMRRCSSQLSDTLPE
jgi:hypothetical protein